MKLESFLLTALHYWRWMLLALILPIAAGLVVALLSPPKYAAQSVLAVLVNSETTSSPNLSGFGPSIVSVEMLKVVRAEIEILQSPETIRQALKSVGIGRIFPSLTQGGWFSSAPDPDKQMDAAIDAFAKSLHADTDTNTNLIRVDFASPSREISVLAVDALVNTYLSRRAQLLMADTSHFLSAQVAGYAAQLAKTESDIQQIRAKYSVLDISQEQQISTVRRNALAQSIASVREQLATNAAQLATAKALRDGQPGQILNERLAQNTANNDDGANMLARLMQERQHLAANYAPDYPPLLDLDARIAATKLMLQDSSRSAVSTTREVRNPVLEVLAQRIVTLQLEQSALTEQARQLEQQSQAEAERQADLRQADVQLRELQERRNTLQDVVRQLTTREADNRIAEESGRGRNPGVRVLQTATAPRDGRSLRKLMVAAGAVGGGIIATALVVLLTVTRRVFLSADEAARFAGLPCLARFTPFGRVVRARLAENDRNDVAIGELAAQLIDLAPEHHGPGVVLLLGTDAQDQRAAVAQALAVDLQHRLGRPVVVIDPQTETGTGQIALLDANVPQEAILNRLNNLRHEVGAAIVIGPVGAEAYPTRRLIGLVDACVLIVGCESSRRDQVVRAARRVSDAAAAMAGFVFTREDSVLMRRLEKWL